MQGGRAMKAVQARAMAKATPEQTKKAHRAAGVVAALVVAFALAFMGLIAALDSIAAERQQEEVEIEQQEKQAPAKPFYVLLIGSDTRKGTALYTGKPTEHAQVDQRSDVMTLMRIDPQDFSVSLLTIPRDTVIHDDGEKINNALLGNDPDQVVDAVAELTGLKADYYMLTTFGTFADLIDAIGGVDVDVPRSVKVSDPITGGTLELKAGKNQHLDGAQALALARARAEYIYDQDAVRQANVRELEAAIIRKMLDGDGVSVQALVVLLRNDVRTNMDLVVLGLAVKEFIDNADKVTISAGTGPFDGGPREEDGLWVVKNDQGAWTEIMGLFETGKDFTQVVPVPEFAVDEGGESLGEGAPSGSGEGPSPGFGGASDQAKQPDKQARGQASAASKDSEESGGASLTAQVEEESQMGKD